MSNCVSEAFTIFGLEVLVKMQITDPNPEVPIYQIHGRALGSLKVPWIILLVTGFSYAVKYCVSEADSMLVFYFLETGGRVVTGKKDKWGGQSGYNGRKLGCKPADVAGAASQQAR